MNQLLPYLFLVSASLVAAFFAHAAPFLERREAEHNLILGLRNRLLRDPHAFGEEDPYLAVAESAGEIVGVHGERGETGRGESSSIGACGKQDHGAPMGV